MKEKPVLNSRLIITFLIVAVVALLAVHYFLGMDYRRQCQGHEALTAQVNEAAQTLAQTPKPAQDLEQRLASAEAGLVAAQRAFLGDLNSTLIINDILKLADECQVWAIPLVTQPWAKGGIREGYDVFRLRVVVTGSFSQLTSFVSRLESGEIGNFVVESLSVSRVSGVTEEGAVPVVASLNLAVYTQFVTSE